MSGKRLPKIIYKPRETVDPQALIALSMDDIAISLSELVKLETENQKLLANSYTLLADILTELREDADEGGDLPLSGIVTTTDFIYLDTITSPEHPVKSCIIINDGLFSIWAGRNVTKAGLQPVLEDISSNQSRFREIKPGEDTRFIFNRRKTENVAFIAVGGDCAYRCYLAW